MPSELDRRAFLAGAVALAVRPPISHQPAGTAFERRAPVMMQRSGSARSMSSTFFGLNGNNLQERFSWDRVDLDTAVSAIHPGLLRYPAGTISNYWAWQSGWFQPNGPWPGQTNGQTGQIIAPFDNSLTPFKTALQRTGAHALFVVNMLTTGGRLATNSDNAAMITDQIAFLHAAQAAGIAVEKVELGNEFYLSGAQPGPNGNDYTTRFATATAYANQSNAWVTALRSAFPTVQIAAVGTDATGNNGARREGWNAGVLAKLAGAQALTLHPYIPITDGSVTPQSLLSLPYGRIQSLLGSEFPAIAAKGLSAWVTEFNMVDRTPNLAFAGTWTHGLFVGAYAILLTQVPTVTLLDLHNVLGDCVAGCLFDSTDGFRAATPVTTVLARTAMGSTYALVLQAASGATSARPLAFPNGPVLAGSAPALVGTEFTGGAQHQALVFNLGAKGVTLSLSGLFSGAVHWSKTTAPALTTRVTGPTSLTTTAGTSTSTVFVPAHSVIRLFV